MAASSETGQWLERDLAGKPGPVFRIAPKNLILQSASRAQKGSPAEPTGHTLLVAAQYNPKSLKNNGLIVPIWRLAGILFKKRRDGPSFPILPGTHEWKWMMPDKQRASLDEIRVFFAKLMAAASGTDDPRYERAFELVRREAFLGPGPWHAFGFTPVAGIGPHYVETPSADPVYLYQNLLFALDVGKRINNGEPFLHAGWLGSVSPKPGEAVCHIGAGTGYYSALLSVLTLPDGTVKAFEIDEILAHKARRNLDPFENVSLTTGDATRLPLPPSDLIYVNAGVVAPPSSWLRALRPRGRIIFPWRPSETVGLTLLLTRAGAGFRVKPLGPSWFIPCVGASNEEECIQIPDSREAWSTRSAWLTADREPDQTAVAIYRQMWFSSAEIAAAA